MILNSSPGCHNLSNALLTSKNAVVQYCWLSIVLLMISVKRWHCGVGLSEPRLMLWDPVLRVQFCTEFLTINFSGTFEIIGSKLIGP